jgi:hypothetical protein
MPLQKITFKPGINLENTNYTNEGGWYQMDKVRFRSGTPEKIGGWILATNYDVDPASANYYSYNFQGVCRDLVNWASLSGENLIGVGTHLRYYLLYGGVYRNITPYRSPTNALTNPFTTVSGSSVVTVVDNAHGAAPGDFVIFSGSAAVGGIAAATINSTVGYQVRTVIDLNTFTVDFGTVATSSATGGGASVNAAFEVSVGLPVYTLGNGWGAGPWNGSQLGAGATTLAVTSGAGVTKNVYLNAIATTINVASTTSFPTAGTIQIEWEIITYTGKTSTTFTGCTRGTNGSIASFHAVQPTAGNGGSVIPIPVRQFTALVGVTGWGQASAVSGVGQQLRLWTSDNYGQDLLIAPRGGAVYYWAKDTSSFARAVTLKDKSQAAGYPSTIYNFVPTTTNKIMVSDVSRFAICFGANSYDPFNSGTVFDPMLIRWSDQENAYNWTPTVINQAGEQRLSTGSFIVTAAKMKQEILVWTDAALYSMQYLGPPFVWGVNPLMSNLSIISPNAVATVNNAAYWMGADKFYMYDGRVQTLPCSLRQYIFTNIANNQQYQTFSATNEGFNEIWWFYVSQTEEDLALSQGRDPTVDRYVIYNHLEQIWYYGNLSRTAWVDSPLQPGPLTATGNSVIGQTIIQEQGNDDVSTNVTNPITAYIQSADFDIEDGNQFMFVWRMLPDVSFTGSTVANPTMTISLIPRQNSGAPYGTSVNGPTTSAQTYSPTVKQYIVQQFTQQLNTRVRGRQMAMRLESTAVGVQWQGGVVRIDSRADGKKS